MSGDATRWARHDFVSWIRAATDYGNPLAVASRCQPGIASPSVGIDRRPGHHRILNEAKKTVRGDILDAPKADAAGATAILLGSDPNDRLVIGFSASALFRAADIKWRRPRQPRIEGPVRAAPSPAAACAAKSRRSRSYQVPTPAAVRARSPRSSGWSQTTSPGTIATVACGRPGLWRPGAAAHRCGTRRRRAGQYWKRRDKPKTSLRHKRFEAPSRRS